MGNLFLAIVLSLDSSNYQVRQRAERTLIDAPWLEPALRQHMERTLEMKLRSERIIKVWEDREAARWAHLAPQPGFVYEIKVDRMRAPLTGKWLRNVWITGKVVSIEGKYAYIDYGPMPVGPTWSPIEWRNWTFERSRLTPAHLGIMP